MNKEFEVKLKEASVKEKWYVKNVSRLVDEACVQETQNAAQENKTKTA